MIFLELNNIVLEDNTEEVGTSQNILTGHFLFLEMRLVVFLEGYFGLSLQMVRNQNVGHQTIFCMQWQIRCWGLVCNLGKVRVLNRQPSTFEQMVELSLAVNHSGHHKLFPVQYDSVEN